MNYVKFDFRDSLIFSRISKSDCNGLIGMILGYLFCGLSVYNSAWSEHTANWSSNKQKNLASW